MTEETEYLTIEEAQELTGAHRNTVLYWIRTGTVHAIKNKFHFWQLPKVEILALQEKRQQMAEARAAGQKVINKLQ